MKAIGIIPVRYASTRFPGKAVAKLAGKPVIQHVWERARQSKRLDGVIVACDDEQILQAAQQFGAEAVMTSPDHRSGSDRIAEVAASRDAGIIVNIQGDEPLVEPSVIDALVQALRDDAECSMATAIKVIDNRADVDNPNVVKAVIDNKGYALYFSRAPIPFCREESGRDTARYYKHLGLYAYRRDFLLRYAALPKSPLEEIEQLEQLRALTAGYKIKTIEVDADTVGIDTPEDLARVEAILKKVNV